MAEPTHAHAQEYEWFRVSPSQTDPLAQEEWVIRHSGGIRFRILCYGESPTELEELRELVREHARPPLRLIRPIDG